jgi:hypothetical protein
MWQMTWVFVAASVGVKVSVAAGVNVFSAVTVDVKEGSAVSVEVPSGGSAVIGGIGVSSAVKATVGEVGGVSANAKMSPPAWANTGMKLARETMHTKKNDAKCVNDLCMIVIGLLLK